MGLAGSSTRPLLILVASMTCSSRTTFISLTCAPCISRSIEYLDYDPPLPRKPLHTDTPTSPNLVRVCEYDGLAGAFALCASAVAAAKPANSAGIGPLLHLARLTRSVVKFSAVVLAHSGVKAMSCMTIMLVIGLLPRDASAVPAGLRLSSLHHPDLVLHGPRSNQPRALAHYTP